MKRIFAVILALALLCSAAMAEGFADGMARLMGAIQEKAMDVEKTPEEPYAGFKYYTHMGGSFTAQVPEDAYVFNAGAMDELMQDDALRGDLEAEGMSEEMIALLQSQSMEMEYVYYGNGNFNAVIGEGSGMTNEVLAANVDVMNEEIIRQYTALGLEEENIQCLGILNYNGIPYYAVYADYVGSCVHTYMTCKDGYDYNFSFTDFDSFAEAVFLGTVEFH